MLGGIIGDLAASYLREPQVFYKQLFDEGATLSEYGLSILATASLIRAAILPSSSPLYKAIVSTSLLSCFKNAKNRFKPS